MRVLVVLNSLELGGTQIPAVDFARRLRERGVESILIGDAGSMGRGPSLLDYAQGQGVSIRPYRPDPGVAAHGRQLSGMADDLGVDLVHVYGMWGAGRSTFWGPARWGRRPWVQTVYEMSVTSVVHRHMPLVVGTQYLLEELAHRPGRTLLVSPPVDLAADAPEPRRGRRFREENGLGDGVLLGIVSRLDARMKATAIGVAIDAMHHLAATGATLFVVGGGDAEDALRRRADGVNAAVGRAAVRLLGPRTDPRPAYSAADVVLGMGGSAARALAGGKPLVVQGEAGWSQLFDETTADSLARSSYWSPESPQAPVADLLRVVSPLLDDPDRRRRLGAYGRLFAAERFGLEEMTERMARFYDEAVSAYGAREWVSDLPREARRLVEALSRRIGIDPAVRLGETA